MNNLDEKLISKLRNIFIEHKTIIAVLNFLIEKLHLTNDSRLIVILYIQKAFLLNLGDAKSVGAWEFFHGGTWTNEEIEAEFNSQIIANQDNWNIGSA